MNKQYILKQICHATLHQMLHLCAEDTRDFTVRCTFLSISLLEQKSTTIDFKFVTRNRKRSTVVMFITISISELYILLSRHQNTGQNHNIKTSDISLENVAQFKYLGMTV
jgi:hypothetical protein